MRDGFIALKVMDDSPCSSSMLSPSPVKHLMSTAQQPHPMQQSCSTANLTKQHPQLAAKLLQVYGLLFGVLTVNAECNKYSYCKKLLRSKRCYSGKKFEFLALKVVGSVVEG